MGPLDLSRIIVSIFLPPTISTFRQGAARRGFCGWSRWCRTSLGPMVTDSLWGATLRQDATPWTAHARRERRFESFHWEGNVTGRGMNGMSSKRSFFKDVITKTRLASFTCFIKLSLFHMNISQRASDCCATGDPVLDTAAIDATSPWAPKLYRCQKNRLWPKINKHVAETSKKHLVIWCSLIIVEKMWLKVIPYSLL